MLDLKSLFRLRVAVARYGEMDSAKWWNTRGQLGTLGAAALRRGFPRTHWFAQARSVFAVAAHRCEEMYRSPDAMTLWRLGDSVEEEFEASWEVWTDNAESWNSFFEAVAPIPGTGLGEFLTKLDLIDKDFVASWVERLRDTPGDRAVELPGGYQGTGANVQMLALGFCLARPSELLVPYLATRA
jgi:hypothetical protein